MRIAVLSLAALVAVAAAIPVLATGGHPRLGNLQAGPYSVTLYNDSPTLVTGRNLLTIEVPRDAAARGVQLTLAGTNRRPLTVRLRPVAILGGANGGHSGAAGHEGATTSNAGAGTGHEGAATGDAGAAGGAHHGLAPAPQPAGAGGGHEAAPAEHQGAGTDGHSAAAPVPGAPALPGALVSLRGTVDVPSAGAWTARVSVTGPAGEMHSAEVVLDAVHGGPSRFYLLVTGTLIGGSLLFGAVANRRRPASSHRGTR